MSKFTDIVDLVAKMPDDDHLMALITQVKNGETGLEDIAYLAKVLAYSGSVIDSTGTYTDVPSTGGPSSLSTLLCPLLLNSCGFKVIKLGVPGRPAGGIDVLAQIDNYRLNYSKYEIELSIKNCDYIHFIADSNFTPLDLRLFEFRKRNDALNLPPLVIASLLSKKIACGLKLTGLDIRVGSHGNFGRSFDEARINARKFRDVADLVGIKAYPFLTAGEYACQPFIGRGESLLALYEIFEKSSTNSGVKKHLDMCGQIVSAIVINNALTFRLSIPKLKECFIRNLEVQETSYKSFLDSVERINRDSFHELKATTDGFVSYEISEIRELIVGLQTEAVQGDHSRFPDPAGLTLLSSFGEYVEAGNTVGLFRLRNSLSAVQRENALRKANKLLKFLPFSEKKNELEIA